MNKIRVCITHSVTDIFTHLVSCQLHTQETIHLSIYLTRLFMLNNWLGCPSCPVSLLLILKEECLCCIVS